MVLPLAPGKRTSRTSIPPAVWVRRASTPPAKIKTNPIIASVHLRCMAAPPCVVPCRPDRLVSGAFLFRRRAYPKAKGAQAKAVAFHMGIRQQVVRLAPENFAKRNVLRHRHCERSRSNPVDRQKDSGLLPPTHKMLRRTLARRSSPIERRRVVAVRSSQ